MTFVEALLLGAFCALRALREARRPAVAVSALGPAVALVFAVIAFAWASHPAFSWAMVPLVRWLAGDGALRYPELYHRLPELAASARTAVAVLIAPLAAGAATRVYDDAFRGRRPRPLAATGEALRRGVALMAAALPVIAVTLALEAGQQALADFRLSGVTRVLVPYAVSLVTLFVRAGGFYAAALVMLGGRGPLDAIASLPGTWSRGYVPALVATLLLSLALVPFTMLEPWGAAGGGRDLPEAAGLVAVVRAVVEAGIGLAASGAAVLAWRSADVDDTEEG
jgi:hypothetical protein